MSTRHVNRDAELRQAIGYLRSHDVAVDDGASFTTVATLICQLHGRRGRKLDKPGAAKSFVVAFCRNMHRLDGKRLRRQENAAQKRAPMVRARQRGQGSRFYQTREWKEARYDALVRSRGACECCGASPRTTPGVTLNVDHIQPISDRPDLALVQSNLQVLCSSCNWGKGARDTTDWRTEEEDPLTALDREFRAIMGAP